MDRVRVVAWPAELSQRVYPSHSGAAPTWEPPKRRGLIDGIDPMQRHQHRRQNHGETVENFDHLDQFDARRSVEKQPGYGRDDRAWSGVSREDGKVRCLGVVISFCASGLVFSGSRVQGRECEEIRSSVVGVLCDVAGCPNTALARDFPDHALKRT